MERTGFPEGRLSSGRKVTSVSHVHEICEEYDSQDQIGRTKVTSLLFKFTILGILVVRFPN